MPAGMCDRQVDERLAEYADIQSGRGAMGGQRQAVRARANDRDVAEIRSSVSAVCPSSEHGPMKMALL